MELLDARADMKKGSSNSDGTCPMHHYRHDVPALSNRTGLTNETPRRSALRWPDTRCSDSSAGRPWPSPLARTVLDDRPRIWRSRWNLHFRAAGWMNRFQLAPRGDGVYRSMTRHMARIAAIRRVGQAERRPTGRGLVGLISFDPPYQYPRA